MSECGTNRLPSKDIDLVLSSTTSAWGPLACIGHEGGVDPGDWWGAFWWAMEQRWQSLLAEQTEAEEPTTKQTTLQVATEQEAER